MISRVSMGTVQPYLRTIEDIERPETEVNEVKEQENKVSREEMEKSVNPSVGSRFDFSA